MENKKEDIKKEKNNKVYAIKNYYLILTRMER